MIMVRWFECKMNLLIKFQYYGLEIWLQDEFDKNKQPREQQFFGGEFSPLGNKKIKSSATHKKDIF